VKNILGYCKNSFQSMVLNMVFRVIGIFGSVARDQQTEDSDVDILIEAPVLDLLSLIGIKYQLEEMLGTPVDVVRKTEYMPHLLRERVEREVIYV